MPRLIGQYRQHGRIRDRHGSPANAFAWRDTEAKFTLLSQRDALYGILSRAPNTGKRCEQAYEFYRDQRYQHINITSRCVYLEDEAAVVIQFGPHILPYISQLHDRYKPYLLRTAMKMKSGYGIRLYELCHRWAWVTMNEFDVHEFKHLMGLEDKYKIFRDLRNYVIKPAIADVNEHTEFTVTYDQRKTGRTITHIQFGIREKKKTSKKVVTVDPDRISSWSAEQPAQPPQADAATSQ